MKKIVILLTALVFFMTGCSVTTLSNVDVGSNVEKLLSEKTTLYSEHFDGYKYYLPKGMSFLNKDEYNSMLIDGLGNRYFLYVDAISYYHKVKNTYVEKKSSYYSKKLNYNKKTGYIQIDEKEDGYYLVNFMFNYAKMECLVKEKNLISAINNMCCILRSVKFNNKVLESLIGENILSYQEENFSLFDNNNSTKEDFLDVISKYEEEDYSKFIDEENIDLDEE